MLKLLDKKNDTLFQLSNDFWGAYNDGNVVCFFENQDTPHIGGLLKILERFLSLLPVTLLTCSDRGYGIDYFPGERMMYVDKTHTGLNKFSSMEDLGL